MVRNIHPNHIETPKNFCRLPNGYGVVKIAVSGSADTTHYGLEVFEKAKEVGREIAKQGSIINTGATTGFPFYAALGAKDESGFSIGFSPASSEREHLESYKLPLDYMDVVVYTGFGYTGRDLLLVRASDAVIVGSGRIGTINEFAVAFEDRRPIGVLEGGWETDEILHHIITASHRPHDKVIFDSDPKSLVERLIEMVQKDRLTENLVYNNHDGWGGDIVKSELIL
jgi:uncharacterized protein (TIGR00725 family)